MAFSIGGGKNKSKQNSTQTQQSTTSTSYNPAFQAQLNQRLADVQGRAYEGLDPNAYQQYMSPYQQEVIDATTADINAQRGLAANEMRGNQAARGAFSNDRRGIEQAELSGQYDRTLASTLAALRNQGYGQAVGIAQNENTNKNAYGAQNDQQVLQLLAMLAEGNKVTNSSGSGTAKGTTTGYSMDFGFSKGGRA